MTVIRPLLYSLADALEMDLSVDNLGVLQGTRKGVLELFQDYSPTLCSSVCWSCIDKPMGVVAADVHVWGKVGVTIVVEEKLDLISLFVTDRNKVTISKDNFPFDSGHWSRRRLYEFVEPGLKAVYYRNLIETDWQQLENGVVRLRTYNQMRSKKLASREAFEYMWGDRGRIVI